MLIGNSLNVLSVDRHSTRTGNAGIHGVEIRLIRGQIGNDKITAYTPAIATR